METTKASAAEAQRAREELQNAVEDTRQITSRLALLEEEVLQYRDQILRVRDQAGAGQPGDSRPASPSEPRERRRRPAMGGDSIGGKEALAQTFGCLVKDREGNLFILTVAGSFKPGDDILQPGPLDGGEARTDVIARVERVIEMDVSKPNQVVGALARVLDPSLVSAEIRGIGKLHGIAEPRLGSRVRKSGRTTGVTEGQITNINISGISFALPGGTAMFNELLATERMTQGGDSGAILVDENNNAIGMAFGGSQSVSLFIPIRKVLDAFGVSLVTEL